ncbi:hypothetical protein CPB85DRAFT_195099 [Mucidula mucida]|nr:hypothetical protein CPB85DRAFT_195099 [Mucidula mucida]
MPLSYSCGSILGCPRPTLQFVDWAGDCTSVHGNRVRNNACVFTPVVENGHEAASFREKPPTLFNHELSSSLNASPSPAMPPAASLPIVPWVSLADFSVIAHQRGFGEQCAIPFPRVFKPPRKFFLVLTLVDLYGKKYEGSTSAYKDDTWKYDRITLYVAYIEYFSSDFALQT